MKKLSHVVDSSLVCNFCGLRRHNPKVFGQDSAVSYPFLSVFVAHAGLLLKVGTNLCEGSCSRCFGSSRD